MSIIYGARRLRSRPQWAVDTRQHELIGEDYGGRAQAATACPHDSIGDARLDISEVSS